MIVFALLAGLIGTLAAIWVALPLLGASQTNRLPAFITIFLIAILSLGIYAFGGSPSQPGQPYGPRLDALLSADMATLGLPEQEERLRYQIRQQPETIEPRLQLGELLSRTERSMEAVAVLERAVAIAPTATTYSSLGQAIVTLNQGTVTDDAERAFNLASQDDPTRVEPAFFLGVARYQSGDRAAATEYWTDILGSLEQDDPLRQAIIARSADLLSRPNIDAASVDAASEGPPPIEQMLIRLETRLDAEPNDFSGWLTLARARANLGDLSAAADALEQADTLFGDSQAHTSIITALAGYIAAQNTPQNTPAENDTGENE